MQMAFHQRGENKCNPHVVSIRQLGKTAKPKRDAVPHGGGKTSGTLSVGLTNRGGSQLPTSKKQGPSGSRGSISIE